MPIQQTVKHGIPIIDGVYHIDSGMLRRYDVSETENGRSLTLLSASHTVRIWNKQLYVYCAEKIIPVPEQDAEIGIGQFRDIACGYVMQYSTTNNLIQWFASFSYAAPFIKGRIHGTRLLLTTADNELWQMVTSDLAKIEVSILSQHGKIIRNDRRNKW